MKLLVLLVLAGFGLAGCASPTVQPAEDDIAPSSTIASEPPVEGHHLSFHSVIGAADVELPSGPNVLSFTSGKNATGVLVELAWNHTVWAVDAFLRAETFQCTDAGSGPTTDLVEQVFCPMNDAIGYPRDGEFRSYGGTMGQPQSPTGMLIEGEDLQSVSRDCDDDCDWWAWAEAPEPRADVEWHLFVSVFYGEIPADYTAIPWLQ